MFFCFYFKKLYPIPLTFTPKKYGEKGKGDTTPYPKRYYHIPRKDTTLKTLSSGYKTFPVPQKTFPRKTFSFGVQNFPATPKKEKDPIRRLTPKRCYPLTKRYEKSLVVPLYPYTPKGYVPRRGKGYREKLLREKLLRILPRIFYRKGFRKTCL